MNIRKSETENDIVTVTIRVSPEEFEKALKEAYLEHTERFTVPGYAAGLAPREALEQVYGHTTLYDEALDLCVPHLFNRFLQETETRIVGRPKVTEITWLAGGGVDFTVEAARYPEIELGVYKGLGVSVRREENEDIFSREMCIRDRPHAPGGVPGIQGSETGAGAGRRIGHLPIRSRGSGSEVCNQDLEYFKTNTKLFSYRQRTYLSLIHI